MSAYALAFPPQREPALLSSFLLAAAMHAVLIAIMFLGVRFQSHPPAIVEVELWDTSPPPPPQAEVKPEPPPPPPKVEPPKPEPAKPVAKPDIVVAKKPELKPKPKAKPEPKRDRDSEKRMREQLAMEQRAVAELDSQRKERELKALIAKREADARSKALAAWQDKIRSKIRSNIILPRDILGNPEKLCSTSRCCPPARCCRGR